MKRNLFVGITSVLLIALFVYAAIAKLTDYYDFQFGLSESPFIAQFSGLLAWAIPASELLIAVMLVVPALRLAGLYASFVMMLLFTLYIASMLAFGKDIPCSCGGILEEMSWGVHIIFNSFFVVMSAIAIRLKVKRRRVIQSERSGSSHPFSYQ
jgi:hypothetical protein